MMVQKSISDQPKGLQWPGLLSKRKTKVWKFRLFATTGFD